MADSDRIFKKYFDANVEDSIFEFSDHLSCSICGRNDSPILEADDAYVLISNYENLENVCLKCLGEKKYAFEQETEGGFLTEKGITTQSEKYPYEKQSQYYEADLLPKEQALLAMKPEQIEELKHTPPFNSWQGAVWQQHCSDFMVFIGTWSYEDFVQNSPDGNGKKYFLEVCSNGDEDLYESQFGPNRSEYSENVFYAFKCLHCQAIVGYVD